MAHHSTKMTTSKWHTLLVYSGCHFWKM